MTLSKYTDLFNSIVWVFENHSFCPNKSTYFTEFRTAYRDYLEIEITYKPDSYIYDVETKNYITSEEECLNKYYRLTRKAEKDVASYLHAMSVFKRNNLLEL